MKTTRTQRTRVVISAQPPVLQHVKTMLFTVGNLETHPPEITVDYENNVVTVQAESVGQADHYETVAVQAGRIERDA